MQKNYISGNTPIYMSITVDGKCAEIAASRDCNPSRWSKGSSRLIGTKEDVKMLNFYLDQLQSSVYQAHQELVSFGIVLASEAIKCRYLGKTDGSHTLLEAVLNELEKEYETQNEMVLIDVDKKEVYFYSDESTQFHMPTIEFKQIVEAWRDFLLTPPLNG